MTHTNPRRVAVVAVHGVADQRQGETVSALAAQLSLQKQTTHTRADLELHVSPLNPVENVYRRAKPKPRQYWRRAKKSLLQSFRSDFLDIRIGGAQRADAASSAYTKWADPGIRFTDYLLTKSNAARMPEGADLAQHVFEEEATSVPCVSLRDTTPSVDLYEMFWADLSRVKSGVVGIVTDLFTLLFLLSRIGMEALFLAHVQEEKNRHTEQRQDGEASRLRVAAWGQRVCDWIFSRVLAPAAMQPVVAALVLGPAILLHDRELRDRAAAEVARTAALDAGLTTATVVGLSTAAAVGVSIGGLAAFWFIRRLQRTAGVAAGIVAAAALATAVLAYVANTEGDVRIPMVLWLIAVAFVQLAFLLYSEERYRGVLGIGTVYLIITMAVILRTRGLDTAQGWIEGCLRALESWLLVHACAWGSFALLLAALVIVSARAREQCVSGARRQALVTAQITLFSSVGAFAVAFMVGLALISQVLGPRLGKVRYIPFHFDPLPHQLAAEFLAQRAEASAISLAPIALLLLGLVGFALFVFMPSLIRELRLSGSEQPVGLGRWLTSGYGSLERLVRVWSYAIVVAAVLIGGLLLLGQFGYRSQHLPPWTGLPWLVETCAALSRVCLSSFVYVLGGGTVGLLAMGQFATKRLRGLRIPLDAMLDVGNHFVEFPRKAIIRARIFERYVALLNYVTDQGYDRIVIVAHSQGSVITADLLRYLNAPEHKEGSAIQQLAQTLRNAPTMLLTVGSPLRQLYALRFPDLYEWVLADCVARGGCKVVGPAPEELGLAHWSNLWGTGDYVGRWLWSPCDGTHPKALQPGEYDPDEGPLEGLDWTDRSIGADAHTHYFDRDQRWVAEEVWRLIGGPIELRPKKAEAPVATSDGPSADSQNDATRLASRERGRAGARACPRNEVQVAEIGDDEG